MTIHRTAGMFLLVSALALAQAGCGDSKSTSSPTQPTPPGGGATGTITIEGFVFDGGTTPLTILPGAVVRLSVDGDAGRELTTDATGHVSFDIPSPTGSTAVDVSAPGFAALHFPFDVGHDRDVRLTIVLSRAPSA
jgi:hypothetical protein